MTYLPTLTNEELLRYAIPETELEKELIKRWKAVFLKYDADEVDDLLQEIYQLKVTVRDLKEELADNYNNVV